MTVTEQSGPDVWADPAAERLGTSANVVTAVRTVAAVVLARARGRGQPRPARLVAGRLLGRRHPRRPVARLQRCETRIGAVLDILCDRFSAAAFYLGLAWLQPEHVLPVMVYLAEFMVVDCFLSLAFLAWPIRSPNYFYVVDRTIWLWNWSKPGQGRQLGDLRGDPACHRGPLAGRRSPPSCWRSSASSLDGWHASGSRCPAR